MTHDIKPTDKFLESHRTGTLRGMTVEKIEDILGFAPNSEGDTSKTTAQWGFTIDGKDCSIWDYKGSAEWQQFSAFVPHELLTSVFGEAYRAG